MCGLVGFLNFDYNLELNNLILNNMSAKINHRGPDDKNNTIIDNILYLSHLRLSIIDTSKNGSQPMYSSSSRYVICFNGEIYNHLKIREELKKYKNIKWLGNSDTETLIESFEFFGVNDTLDKISGMFAIALIDRQNHKLFLIRDRIGEKPLYFGFNNEIFFFSSEIKALKENKKIEFKVNQKALAKYFKYGYVPSPLSIYENIFKLKPASYIEINYKSKNFSNYKTFQYWNINNHSNKKKLIQDKKNITNHCEDLIYKSINEQLLSDVPLGAFLSSGIDSSLIVSIISKKIKQNIDTFSIGFDEKNYNEAINSKKIANYLGTSHHELYVTSNIVLDQIPKISEIYDEPFADSSQIPTYLVSNFAKKNVTVALSGDGGDEMFAGYNRYINSQKILKFNQIIPTHIKNLIKFMLTRFSPQQWNKFIYVLNNLYLFPKISLPGDKIYKLIDLIYKNDISNLYDYYVSFWKNYEKPFINNDNNLILDEQYIFTSEKDFISEMMIIDSQSYLPDDILVKVDRATMSNSLESRAPFLNRELMEYVQRIDINSKYNKKNKIILRDILSKYLPKSLFDLPKAGFAMPIDIWLRNDLKDWAISLIDKKELTSNNYFNAKNISSIFDEHINNKRNWSNKIWTFLMFQSWLKNN